MKSINEQVLGHIRPLVISQLVYVSVDGCDGDNMDNRIAIGETLSDEQKVALLTDGPLLSDESLLELATSIGLYDLFNDDADIWGTITDYIHKHDAQCLPLWDHISKMLDDSSCLNQ